LHICAWLETAFLRQAQDRPSQRTLLAVTVYGGCPKIQTLVAAAGVGEPFDWVLARDRGEVEEEWRIWPLAV